MSKMEKVNEKLELILFNKLIKKEINTEEDVNLIIKGHKLKDINFAYQDEKTGNSLLMIAAKYSTIEVANLLLTYGAIWNQVNREYKCAGDFAIESKNQEMINLILNAGVRAELLFYALEDAKNLNNQQESDEYLQNDIKYDEDEKILYDSKNQGVMMDWETNIMKITTQILFRENADYEASLQTFNIEPKTKEELVCLNVGFGLGIIDKEIQLRNPKMHYIMEAHPQVYKKMIADGWDKKPNVKILFGKWQDTIKELLNDNIKLDMIYFDTFGENFSTDMRLFHRHLPNLLNKHGRYSFFNGFCPDNTFFLATACEICKIQLLNELGFLAVDFFPVTVKQGSEEYEKDENNKEKVWNTVSRKYFYDNTYHLPVALYN